VNTPATRTSSVVTTSVAAPAKQAGPAAMPSADFEELIAAIKEASFEKQKLDVLKTAAPRSNLSYRLMMLVARK
jgi:hypothetical protein